MAEVMDEKTCPKCSARMNVVETAVAIPKHIDTSPRRSDDETQAISLSIVFGLEMYCCSHCRFVEL